MAVRIRLTRMGRKGRPFYRVVVAHAASPRDGAFIEQLGIYDPMTEPSTVRIDEEKALKWIRNGAQPTESVVDLFRRTGLQARIEAMKAAKSGAEAA